MYPQKSSWMKRRRQSAASASSLVPFSVEIILQVINTQLPSFIMHCSWSVVETVFRYSTLKSIHTPKISLHILDKTPGVSERFEVKIFTYTQRAMKSLIFDLLTYYCISYDIVVVCFFFGFFFQFAHWGNNIAGEKSFQLVHG